MTTCMGAGGHVGQKFTYAQLQALWINAGGSRAVAPIAAAIAMAESGGCSAALNAADNGGKQASWGLWQISDGTHAQPVADILNPTVNASAAVEKYRGAGGSFGPWGSYSSGAYRAYVSTSTTPDFTGVPQTTSGSPAPTVPVTANSTSSPSGAPPTGCLFGIPAISVSFAPDFPGLCLITKGQGRQVLGAALMITGTGLMLSGVAVVVAGAVGQSKAARLAASVVT